MQGLPVSAGYAEWTKTVELNKQISRHNYYAFLWHAVFLALAVNFMDIDTIIPVMLVDAGGSSFQLGILIAIMLGGGRFAQLFFAPFLNNQALKKGYLLGGISARILLFIPGRQRFYCRGCFHLDFFVLFKRLFCKYKLC